MKLFGQLIRTVVNVAVLPVAAVKDVLTLGGVATGQNKTGHLRDTAVGRQVTRVMDDAEER